MDAAKKKKQPKLFIPEHLLQPAGSLSFFLSQIQAAHFVAPHSAVELPLEVCLATYTCFILEGGKPFSAPTD